MIDLDSGDSEEPRAQAAFRLHLEPERPLEIDDLTSALGSLSRQYQKSVMGEGHAEKVGDPRLLISSIHPGSIEINFIPDILAFGVMLWPLIDVADTLNKFVENVDKLLGFFVKDTPPPDGAVTIKDCDDAINIVKPIANSGGSQTFNVISGGLTVNVLQLQQQQAKKIKENATHEKARLQFPKSERKQRVSMVWKQLARDKGKVGGTQSPDKAQIDEIDSKPHPAFFTDDTAYLKKEMIDDQENPMQKVYFVDVEVSRVEDKVRAYRIVGYHGTDDLYDVA